MEQARHGRASNEPWDDESGRFIKYLRHDAGVTRRLCIA